MPFSDWLRCYLFVRELLSTKRRPLFCVSVNRIQIKFWTTGRFIIKQLDYSLSISMRDSWLGLCPRQISRDKNLELRPRQLSRDRNLELIIWLFKRNTSGIWENGNTNPQACVSMAFSSSPKLRRVRYCCLLHLLILFYLLPPSNFFHSNSLAPFESISYSHTDSSSLHLYHTSPCLLWSYPLSLGLLVV